VVQETAPSSSLAETGQGPLNLNAHGYAPGTHSSVTWKRSEAEGARGHNKTALLSLRGCTSGAAKALGCYRDTRSNNSDHSLVLDIGLGELSLGLDDAEQAAPPPP
jgi:hypothetical protein